MDYIEKYITLDQFIKLGGNIKKGMKLIGKHNIFQPITNPEINHHSLHSLQYESTSSKEYTFDEIIKGKGVKVLESDKLLGTGWLFTLQKFKLY